jgi:hypothetical protein
MTDFEPKALHLHTLKSLLIDLVSGRPVLVGDNEQYELPDDATRSALKWYQDAGIKKWAGSVTAADGENLVDATLKAPTEIPSQSVGAVPHIKKRLTLKKLEAHRFAGLHKFGTPALPPHNYVHEFASSVTLFEGRNGSGKTSLANAVIWALTGELLRAQRPPQKSDEDFQCWIDSVDEGDPSAHLLTPVTPLPDVADFRPSETWVPADTWVELTFEDENGALLPPIRRTQGRTARGKPVEECDLTPLGIDPIAARIGTVMPGMLSLIKVGSESELGKAVSELTGLSALSDLADHARRAKQKIDKEFIRNKTTDLDRIDQAYFVAKTDLERDLSQNPSLRPPLQIPAPSQDTQIESTLNAVVQHFDELKSTAFGAVKEILGETFDPTDQKNKSSLERNIGPAISEINQLGRLSSLERLQKLKALTAEDISATEVAVHKLVSDAAELAVLAKTPETAARTRLYARIASWLWLGPNMTRILDIVSWKPCEIMLSTEACPCMA